MIIVVASDVHLGYEKCNKADFLEFLDRCDSASIDHLFLLGDILDFWRRNNARAVLENNEIIEKIAELNVRNIHYIVGNHDYYLLKLNERWNENYPFTISKSWRLEDGGKKFYFIHGYELEIFESLQPLSIEYYEYFSEKMCFSEDVLGSFTSHLWDIIQNRGSIWSRVRMMKKPSHERENIEKIYNLAISEAKYMLLGMKPHEILIYGHTHRPFINKKGTVVNTGSWVNELSKKVQNSYVMISDGRMDLKFFDRSKEKI